MDIVGFALIPSTSFALIIDFYQLIYSEVS